MMCPRLLKPAFVPPQPFMAKGRDGKTDIYGIVAVLPSNFDPKNSIPWWKYTADPTTTLFRSAGGWDSGST